MESAGPQSTSAPASSRCRRWRPSHLRTSQVHTARTTLCRGSSRTSRWGTALAQRCQFSSASQLEPRCTAPMHSDQCGCHTCLRYTAALRMHLAGRRILARTPHTQSHRSCLASCQPRRACTSPAPRCSLRSPRCRLPARHYPSRTHARADRRCTDRRGSGWWRSNSVPHGTAGVRAHRQGRSNRRRTLHSSWRCKPLDVCPQRTGCTHSAELRALPSLAGKAEAATRHRGTQTPVRIPCSCPCVRRCPTAQRSRDRMWLEAARCCPRGKCSRCHTQDSCPDPSRADTLRSGTVCTGSDRRRHNWRRCTVWGRCCRSRNNALRHTGGNGSSWRMTCSHC
jgi:hypothetical protein